MAVDERKRSAPGIVRHGGERLLLAVEEAVRRALVGDDLVLDPGGRVIVSVYSSGPIGRLVPQDVAGLAGYLREHTQAS